MTHLFSHNKNQRQRSNNVGVTLFSSFADKLPYARAHTHTWNNPVGYNSRGNGLTGKHARLTANVAWILRERDPIQRNNSQSGSREFFSFLDLLIFLDRYEDLKIRLRDTSCVHLARWRLTDDLAWPALGVLCAGPSRGGWWWRRRRFSSFSPSSPWSGSSASFGREGKKKERRPDKNSLPLSLPSSLLLRASPSPSTYANYIRTHRIWRRPLLNQIDLIQSSFKWLSKGRRKTRYRWIIIVTWNLIDFQSNLISWQSSWSSNKRPTLTYVKLDWPRRHNVKANRHFHSFLCRYVIDANRKVRETTFYLSAKKSLNFFLFTFQLANRTVSTTE